MKNTGTLLGAVALALSLTACQHPTKVAAGPPPPSPAPASTPPPAKPAVAPAIPSNLQPSSQSSVPLKVEEPVLVTPPTVAPPVPEPETKDVPPAVPDKPAASKPVTHVAPKPPTPTPAPPPKPDPPAPTPAPPIAHIEATLPPAEQTIYRKRAERAILETQQNLDAIKYARLNKDDQSTQRQAVTFLRDARKAMAAGDLVGAATLAEKSRLLSQELRKRYS